MAKNIEKIQMLLTEVSPKLKSAGKNHLAPMANMDRALKRACTSPVNIGSHELKSHMEEVAALVSSATRALPARKRAPASGKENVYPPALAPPPKSGPYYGRVEFLRYLKHLEKGKADNGQGAFIKKVLCKNYIPIHQASAYKLISKFDKHVQDGGTFETFDDDPWHCHKGKAAYLTTPELEEIANDSMQVNVGAALSKERFANLMLKVQGEGGSTWECGIA